MSKRLEFLEGLARGGRSDAFALYGLALEYQKLERTDEALATFRALREKFPDYLPQYLMAAKLLQELSRNDEAQEWLRAGIGLAESQNNAHARGELSALLEDLSD